MQNLVSSGASMGGPRNRMGPGSEDSVELLVNSLQRLSLPSALSSSGTGLSVLSSSVGGGSLPYWVQMDRTDPSRSVSSATLSATGGMENAASSITMNNSSLQERFSITRSRVLRLSVRNKLLEYTLPDAVGRIKALQPTLWRSSSAPAPPSSDVHGIFLVFRTHEEACAALNLSSPSFPLVPALETELEHIPNLQQLLWSQVVEEMATVAPVSRMPQLAPRHVNDSGVQANGVLRNGLTPLQTDSFNISTNPPNPKLSFRAGDWMCSVRHCAAHNFGRNVACIRCGTARAMNTGDNVPNTTSSPVSPTHNISPRFMNVAGGQGPNPALMAQFSQLSLSQQSHHHSLSLPTTPTISLTPHPSQPPLSATSVLPGTYPPIPSVTASVSKAPSPSYPLLTPSGRALASGGRVRNISMDPLAPCIMYWPDNEPLPERGQVRPHGSAVVQYPPIINTGNKGAAEKQPGDWVCSKCNYLNWRRRKVCQTCYPYAEGNGDSISAAVQAERIALLANVLNRTSSAISPPSNPLSPLSSSHSTPNGSQALPPVGGVERQVRPWLSQEKLGQSATPSLMSDSKTEYDLKLEKVLMHPIYQTSGQSPNGQHSQTSAFSATQQATNQQNAFAQRGLGLPSPYQNESNLIPAFLQDFLHSPNLSPSVSSASCSSVFEGPHYMYTSSSSTSLNASPDSRVSKVSGRTDAVVEGRNKMYAGSNSSDLSIWRLDGEETRHIRKGFNPAVGSRIDNENAGGRAIGTGRGGSLSGGSDSSLDHLADLTGKTPTNCAVFA